jgi:hypothetical protein
MKLTQEVRPHDKETVPCEPWTTAAGMFSFKVLLTLISALHPLSIWLGIKLRLWLRKLCLILAVVATLVVAAIAIGYFFFDVSPGDTLMLILIVICSPFDKSTIMRN